MQLASVKAADLCGLFPHVRSLCGTTIYFFLSCDTPFKCGEMAGFRNRILRSVDCIAGRQQELISTSMLHQTSLELSKIIKHGPIAESNRWVRLKMRYIRVYQYISNLCEYSNREDDDNDDQPGPSHGFQWIPRSTWPSEGVAGDDLAAAYGGQAWSFWGFNGWKMGMGQVTYGTIWIYHDLP